MPSIASSKVTMTTILLLRKAGPWKRDIEKTKGTNSILETGSGLRLASVKRVALITRVSVSLMDRYSAIKREVI